MAARTRQKRFFHFAAWTLLGTISILVGFALLRLLVPPASGKVNLVVETILGVLGFGILLPLVQWIVLSRFLSNAYWWLIASFTSLLLGLSIDLLVTRWITYPIPGAFSIGMSTAFGLITGAAQWALIRGEIALCLRACRTSPQRYFRSSRLCPRSGRTSPGSGRILQELLYHQR
jgi:hypothetical protein